MIWVVLCSVDCETHQQFMGAYSSEGKARREAEQFASHHVMIEVFSVILDTNERTLVLALGEP